AVFLTALHEQDRRIRLRAATVLAHLGEGGDKPFGVMAEFLADQDDLCDEAIGALAYSGLPALPTVKKCLQDKNPRVRRTAAFTISHMAHGLNTDFPAHEVIDLLTKLLDESDNQVVEGAIGALGTIGPRAKQALPAILKLLKHPDHRVREVA